MEDFVTCEQIILESVRISHKLMAEKKEMYESFFMLDNKLEIKRINPNKLKEYIEELYTIKIQIKDKDPFQMTVLTV